MHDEVFNERKLYSKNWGEPPQFSSPQDKGGEEKHNLQKNCAKKRRVRKTHDHLGTRLSSDVYRDVCAYSQRTVFSRNFC